MSKTYEEFKHNLNEKVIFGEAEFVQEFGSGAGGGISIEEGSELFSGEDRLGVAVASNAEFVIYEDADGVLQQVEIDQITESKDKNEKGDDAEYKKFFKGALKKFGVDEPDQLKGDKEKEFYDYVDKNWKADKETD